MGSVLSSVVPESDIEGYHILFVHENSPAKRAGLEAFFDFIVALCGVVLVGQHGLFMELLQKNMNKQIELKVFSIRDNSFRNVSITPTYGWNGQGLLGLTISFCSVKEALKAVQHVLEVHPNSPAHGAGLRTFSDYIIGVESDNDDENVDFGTLIKQYDQRPLKIFVYNVDDNTCRSTYITPNSQWGGNGVLGCGIGTGYLHRIPMQVYQRSVKSTSIVVTTKVFEKNERMCKKSSNKSQVMCPEISHATMATSVLKTEETSDASASSTDVEEERKEVVPTNPPPKKNGPIEETPA